MAKKGESKTNPGAESVSTTPEGEYPVSAVDHEEIARLAYSYGETFGFRLHPRFA